jgi:glycosyltransferase involved in cell wall biosynthesis
MATAPLDDDAAVDVVVPAHDEARVLAANIAQLHQYLSGHVARPWQITIAQNGSTDATPAVADRLAAELSGVRAVHRDQPGRGAALRHAWSASTAPIVAYLDADLSTRLDSLPPLIDAVASGRADLAIGSRLVPGSSVERRWMRETVSRTYNTIVRTVLHARFHDAQCGFKAARASVIADLLPQVVDDGWFFDTELLVLAQRTGRRIEEIPVRWVDDPDSTVRIIPTAVADLRGVARLVRAGPPPA